MEALLEFIYATYDFFGNGFYEWLTHFFAWVIEWYTIAKLKFMAFMIKFSWDIASNILANIGISDALNAAWGSMNSETLNFITFFRIPEGINLILQAGVTKFVLRTLGI